MLTRLRGAWGEIGSFSAFHLSECIRVDNIIPVIPGFILRRLMTQRKLRLGIAGLGRAFSLMLPGFAKDPRVHLVAAADPRPEARARFASEFSARVYATVEELCADPAADVIYVASPHQLHARHTQLAADKGKHILVEKPMALSLDECRAMIASAERGGVKLIVGHSHSFDLPIRRAGEIIASGAVGRVRMITALNFTDFLYRLRRPEELETTKGGGVFFNQAPHQVDIARYLASGRAQSVRAHAGAWDASRPTEGAYHTAIAFDDGSFASLTYSGFGHFDSDEWCNDVGESGRPKSAASYGAARRLLHDIDQHTAEIAIKAARNYGGSDYGSADMSMPHFYEHFGVVLVSCDRADIRPMPNGIMFYGDDARRFEALPSPKIPRAEVVDELYDVVLGGHPPIHDGNWGLATMEICLAMLQSAREQREIALYDQTPPLIGSRADIQPA